MNAVKANCDYYYLFRGDVRLKKGWLPLSPLARRLIWKGETLEESLEQCKRAVDLIYIEAGEDGANVLKYLLMQYTEKHHFLNPFVSTTSDLNWAFTYASAYPEGYVSVLKIHEDRFIRYGDNVHTPLIEKEKECAVVGLINAEEILFQVPFYCIDEKYRSGSISNEQKVLNFLKEYGTSDFCYSPVTPSAMPCPNCNKPLSPYQKEILGENPKAIQIFELSEEKNPPFVYANNLTKNDLAEYGMIARCASCKAWLVDLNKAVSQPLQILNWWIEDKRIYLGLRNTQQEDIIYISVRVTYKMGDEAYSKLYSYDFTKYPYIMFHEGESDPNKSFIEDINSRCSEFQPCFKPIKGNSEAVHYIDLDAKDIQDIRKINVYLVQFATGKGWMLVDI